MGNLNDTIVAEATPPGKAGVSVVRLSGPKSVEVLKTLTLDYFQGRRPTSHHLYLTKLYHPHTSVLIDEALVVVMRAPHSYTGEDCVEFQCHGGRFIVRQLLESCLAVGARVAHAGEFTQRAYLNGKLDLTQAEAVADLIAADNATAHKLATEHLQGDLGDSIRAFRAKLADVMVLIESAIDFSHEEHVYQIERDEIMWRLLDVRKQLKLLRGTFDAGRRRREGVKVVLLGATNAGKSSLFNRLCGVDRAIVTDIPGTTRDFLEEEITIDGFALRLVDTAGLRDTADVVEQIGVGRSREHKNSADVAVWVVDSSIALEEELWQELQESIQAENQRVIVVLNKADLPPHPSIDAITSLSGVTILSTSLRTDGGVDDLVAQLSTIAAELTSSEGVLISRARHFQAVVQAIEALDRAIDAVRDALDHELIALDVREALDAIGSIVGHVTPDDILNRIFAEFCVGK